MGLTQEQKKTIVKKFLNDSTLDVIMRNVKVTQDDVIEVLLENPLTKDLLYQHIEETKQGKFNWFFSKSYYGRPKLPDNKKRKLRQIRISDDELEQLGNPTTTQMRNNLFKLKHIEEFCAMLDSKGIKLIPDEWLENEYDKNDPFWYQHVYDMSINRLKTIVDNKKCWDDI